MATSDFAGATLVVAVWALAAAALGPLLAAFSPRLREPAARLVRPVGAAALALLAIAAGFALAGVPMPTLRWWPGLPGEPFVLGLDPLAAPFALLLGVVGAASLGAHPPEGSPGAALARLGLHAGFLLALAAVFLARHALLFLCAWELMTLLSAALVASDPTSARGRSATVVYLALSHAGFALVAFALLRLATLAGSFQFPAMAAAWGALDPGEAARLQWLLTAGFAVKLGLVPVHAWLPLAHPEAPAPVSAVLSGVMVKAGLYGVLRFVWAWPGATPAHWGAVLLCVGGLSAVTAAVSAAIESDAKRLLAWSTIKNAGVLAAGLGLAAVLASAGQVALARVAVAAVLLHAIGHGLAKALAFLAIGEAAHAAGTRRLDGMGGLANALPRTSWTSLVAVLSLCALPALPLFASEWLLYQSLILGYSAGGGELRLLAPFAGAGLALATAVTVAAMVKLHGLTFLGRPRRASDAPPVHAERPEVVRACFALAAFVLAAGVGATGLLRALHAPTAALLSGAGTDGLVTAGGLALTPGGLGAASVSPVAVLMLGLLFGALAFAWTRPSPQGLRRAPAWACGAPPSPHPGTSAAGFSRPLGVVFGSVARLGRAFEPPEPGASDHAGAVAPLVHAVLWTSIRVRELQSGSIHLYLATLLATLVALLMWAR